MVSEGSNNYVPIESFFQVGRKKLPRPLLPQLLEEKPT